MAKPIDNKTRAALLRSFWSKPRNLWMEMTVSDIVARSGLREAVVEDCIQALALRGFINAKNGDSGIRIYRITDNGKDIGRGALPEAVAKAAQAKEDATEEDTPKYYNASCKMTPEIEREAGLAMKRHALSEGKHPQLPKMPTDTATDEMKRRVIKAIVDLGAPSTSMEIARAAGITRQAISPSLSRLVGAGRVRRAKQAKDKTPRYEVAQ